MRYLRKKINREKDKNSPCWVCGCHPEDAHFGKLYRRRYGYTVLLFLLYVLIIWSNCVVYTFQRILEQHGIFI